MNPLRAIKHLPMHAGKMEVDWDGVDGTHSSNQAARGVRLHHASPRAKLTPQSWSRSPMLGLAAATVSLLRQTMRTKRSAAVCCNFGL